MSNNNLILTFCLAENTILVSKSIFEALGSPKLVRMRINDEERAMVIEACEYGDYGAIVIPEEMQFQFETPGKSLLRRIRRITGWPDDLPRAVYGTFLPALNMIHFDLMAAMYAVLTDVTPSSDIESSFAENGSANAENTASVIDPDSGVDSAMNSSIDATMDSAMDSSVEAIIDSAMDSTMVDSTMDSSIDATIEDTTMGIIMIPPPIG